MLNGHVYDRPKYNTRGRDGFRKSGNNSKPKRIVDEKLNEISSVLQRPTFGVKHCFSIGKFQKEEIAKFGTIVDGLVEETGVEISKSNNWWTLEFSDVYKTAGIDKIVEEYFSFDESNNVDSTKCKHNVYCVPKFDINFSALNLVTAEDGGVKYPYGAIFFSDSKNQTDMIKGRIACIEDCATQFTKERNPFFQPLEYTGTEFKSLFRSSGRLELFYVDKEIEIEREDGKTEMLPSITVIDILVGATRNKSEGLTKGFIDRAFVSRCDTTLQIVENVPDYILTAVFAKNQIESNADTIYSCASDYLWSVGENYKEFDLDNFSSRRKDLGLAETQKYIGEEWRNKQHFDNKPKKFVKEEISFKTRNEDSDSAGDEETISPEIIGDSIPEDEDFEIITGNSSTIEERNSEN